MKHVLPTDSDGTPLHFAKLSRQIGISPAALYRRYSEGDRGAWLRRPKRIEYKPYYVDGRTVSMVELSKETGKPASMLYEQMLAGSLKFQKATKKKA